MCDKKGMSSNVTKVYIKSAKVTVDVLLSKKVRGFPILITPLANWPRPLPQ